MLYCIGMLKLKWETNCRSQVIKKGKTKEKFYRWYIKHIIPSFSAEVIIIIVNFLTSNSKCVYLTLFNPTDI